MGQLQRIHRHVAGEDKRLAGNVHHLLDQLQLLVLEIRLLNKPLLVSARHSEKTELVTVSNSAY